MYTAAAATVGGVEFDVVDMTTLLERAIVGRRALLRPDGPRSTLP
jgi:hypothetical protein